MKRLLFIILLFLTQLSVFHLSWGNEENRMEWEELVPQGLREKAMKIQEEIFTYTPSDHSTPANEAGFTQFEMSDTRAELDGKQVRITGFVVPLEFDTTYVNEFLLAPYMGACIHVPPPPANQIILVKSKKKVKVDDIYYPLTFDGTLKVEGSETSLAQTAYTLEAYDFKVENEDELFGEEQEEIIYTE